VVQLVTGYNIVQETVSTLGYKKLIHAARCSFKKTDLNVLSIKAECSIISGYISPKIKLF
jgi:hypothetical protein